MSDLFFSIHNDCSYFVETDEPPIDALQFTYNGTANCFQNLLNIIQKVFLLYYIIYYCFLIIVVVIFRILHFSTMLMILFQSII
jgi:hypothetical protein